MQNLVVSIIIAVIAVAIITVNIFTALKFSAKQMKEHFIDGNCIVGRIAAAIFYAPAWAIKGVKFIILYFVAVHKTMSGKVGKITAQV
jgi:hypothetical protein